MNRIAVRRAAKGTGGLARQLGELDDSGLSWAGGRGRLWGTAVAQLVALLGADYMESRFELIIGKQGLGGCEVSRLGTALEFTYAATFLAPSRP